MSYEDDERRHGSYGDVPARLFRLRKSLHLKKRAAFGRALGLRYYELVNLRKRKIDPATLRNYHLPMLVAALEVPEAERAPLAKALADYCENKADALPWIEPPAWRASPVKRLGRPSKSPTEEAMPRNPEPGFANRFSWFFDHYLLPWARQTTGKGSIRGVAEAIGEHHSVVLGWRKGATPDRGKLAAIAKRVGMDDPDACANWLTTGAGTRPEKTGVYAPGPPATLPIPQEGPRIAPPALVAVPPRTQIVGVEGLEKVDEVVLLAQGVALDALRNNERLSEKLLRLLDKIQELSSSVATRGRKALGSAMLAVAIATLAQGATYAGSSGSGGTADARDLGSARRRKRRPIGDDADEDQEPNETVLFVPAVSSGFTQRRVPLTAS